MTVVNPQVHREDETKWARRAGLSAASVRQLWRMASHFADESEDDSRVEQVDPDSLAAQHQILVVTSSGERNCLTVSVFSMPQKNSFHKVWSEQQAPSGEGFCDTPFGEAEVRVWNYAIWISIPEGKDEQIPNQLPLVVFQYGWDKGTYRFIGNKRMNLSSSSGAR